MTINLEELSLKELQDLRRQVDKAIATVDQRQRSAAIASLNEVAKSHGFASLNDLLPNAKVDVKKTRAPAAPKFANPADPSDTWTGRGRKPKWFIEAMAAGKTTQDLLVA